MPKASIIYPSTIVDRNGNGGWHRNGKRAYRKAVQTILQFLQTAKEPRLYHLCFEELDSDEPRTSDKTPHEMNMAMLNAFVQMAEREGIKLEWFAAREQADGTKKDHLHAFVVIDAHGIKVAKLFNQFEDGRVQQFCKAHGVKFAIFSPKDYKGIHGNNTYMALPYQGPGNRQTELGTERLNDALVWLTYNYKARSKPTDDADGQIFPASRPNRKRKEPDASPLADLSAPVQEKGDEMTPAEKFIATKYETAVDAGLDVEALRLYLLAHGVPRTPAQVRHDLDETYGFFGYADSHPAPTMVSAEAWDKAAGRKVEISLVATSKRSYNDRNRSTTTESRP